jgi:hypothetical protein
LASGIPDELELLLEEELELLLEEELELLLEEELKSDPEEELELLELELLEELLELELLLDEELELLVEEELELEELVDELELLEDELLLEEELLEELELEEEELLDEPSRAVLIRMPLTVAKSLVALKFKFKSSSVTSTLLTEKLNASFLPAKEKRSRLEIARTFSTSRLIIRRFGDVQYCSLNSNSRS